MRTLSISMTRLTSPLDGRQEDPMAQEGQEGQEGQTTPTEDHPDQLSPPVTSSLFSPPETSGWLEFPPYCSTATEPELTPLSESFGFT